MTRTTVTRLAATLAIAATMLGAATLATPTSTQAATCGGLPCLIYAQQIQLPPPCIACIYTVGIANVGDPVLITAVNPATGQLLASRRVMTSAHYTFTALLVEAQCTPLPVLVQAVDTKTGAASNQMQVAVSCPGTT